MERVRIDDGTRWPNPAGEMYRTDCKHHNDSIKKTVETVGEYTDGEEK